MIASADELRMDVLPLTTRKAFTVLLTLPLPGRWYLAGGTALALQAGHRQSVDLDFFTDEKSFNGIALAETLSEHGSWETTAIDVGTLHGEFEGAKISFIAAPAFTPHEPLLSVKSLQILTPPDIAPMKVLAISQRGRKRDFVDLHWLCLNVQPLLDSIHRVESQYSVAQSTTHILKSLVYFADADGDPEPALLWQTTWENTKRFFRNEVARITNQLLEGA